MRGHSRPTVRLSRFSTKVPEQPPLPQRRVLQLHDTESGKVVRTFEDAGFGQRPRFTPDGRMLALAEHMAEHINGGLRLHLWDTATGRTTDRIVNAPGWLYSDIAFPLTVVSWLCHCVRTKWSAEEGEGPKLTQASVAVFEVRSGRERQHLQMEPSERFNEIQSSRFSPSGRHLFLGMEDGTVRQWELASGEERRRFASNAGSATSLDFAGRPRAGLGTRLLAWLWRWR